MKSYSNKYWNHKCKEIDETLSNQKTKVAGWLRTKRNHGNILFIDLYDQTGMLQCVIDKSNEYFEILEKLNLESVVIFEGNIMLRSENTINTALKSGKVELLIEKIEILTESIELPFALHQKDLNEELQMKYRFLYLRTNEMQEILKTRTNVINFLRQSMQNLGFQEIQTPLLAGTSPEGARDYIVPSRLNKQKFYALPQAPQQFKQLLMASGIEKYFQIAPCFRDEDSRSDRLVGEFYQLDFEMAFATQEDILKILEEVLSKTFSHFTGQYIKPFTRISYNDAIRLYGSDKPDLRNPLQIFDITQTQETPEIFKYLVQNNGKLLTIAVNMEYNNNELKKLTKLMQEKGAKGLAYCYLKDSEWKGPLAKMLKKETIEKASKNNNILFLIADTKDIVYKLAGCLRDELGKLLNLIDYNKYEFCFITDFPMFEKTDFGWDFMHNPFSMPQNLEAPINEILSYQYDVVCNGYEITSGAVRNHDLNLIKKVFALINQSSEDLEKRFPVFKSFKYGIPPHAGAAPGIDRIIMLISQKSNVRDIVAFPMNQKGENLLMEAPSEIDEKFLKELGVQLIR